MMMMILEKYMTMKKKKTMRLVEEEVKESRIKVVKKHKMHTELKSYKLKLLGKLVIQNGIRAWLGRRSCI